METLDVLLSDQYTEFTTRIKGIAEQKKMLKAEFKEVYDKFQVDVKELDEAALEAQNEFEAWKKERALNCGDG